MIEWYMINRHKLEYIDYCKNNYEAYLTAKDEGDKVGLTVIHGCELRINDVGYNDYLIYGFDSEFFFENPDIFSWGLDRFSKECTERGILVYQAHHSETESLL